VIEFRILGPLEAVEEDRRLALGSPQQRALLALLLIHRGTPVSSDRLIDELWSERPPATANKIVQGYVSNLRKALGDEILVTQARGYLLRSAPGQLDLDRFVALADEGRQALDENDPRSAAEKLRAALACWRGPALAEFAYESFAQSEIARLEEAKLAALEARIDADLALGHHPTVIGELEALVARHPNREHLVGQLMLALYRCGRQRDALNAYRSARRVMLEELGLEPGRELQHLERAILAHDLALEPPRPPPSRAREQPGTAPTRGLRRGGARALITAGAAVLLAALIALAAELSGSGAGTVRVAPNSLAVIDPATNHVVASAPVGARPGPIAFGSGSMWVANLDDQTLSRIDPQTLRILRTIPTTGPPTGITASDSGVWVVESNSNPGSASSTSSVSVSRIDPEFDSFGSPVQIGNVIPSGPGAIAAHGAAVWVAPSTGLLTRLSAATGRVQQQVDPNASPAGIAIGEGAIWLTDPESGNVVRVDPTGLLTPIAVGNGPAAVAVGAGAVWVVDSIDDAVVRIDPGTRSVVGKIGVGRSPAGIAFGDGSVWVAGSGDGTVTRIDPSTDKPMATIRVGGSPQAVAIAAGRAWVSVDAQPVGSTFAGPGGRTLRIVSSMDVDYMDPALAYTTLSDQLLYETCAQLVNYPDKAGPAGSQLVPEVAASLPTRSPDGRTYTFRIRRGFRFSPPLDEAVTAQTFKYAIERTLNPGTRSPLAHYLADVVGAAAYRAGRARQISGVVARGATLTISLIAPAADFLTRLAEPAFCAVPSNTPIDANGVRVIPGAGPYYVTSYAPGQGVVLTRNPNYHGTRPRHFARIAFALDLSPRRAVADIEAGHADYTQLGLAAPSPSISSLASGLAARYGPTTHAAARGTPELFADPWVQLDYFVLNSHRPAFSDVRMRQAVNYAIDRRALAKLGDFYQPLPEYAADHYLPPGMLGYRDARVYPLKPDVTKARALARGGGRTVVLYTCDAFPCPEQAQIVKNDLAAIGLRVEIEKFPLSTLNARETRPGEPYDLAWGGWIPDYPDPSAMFNPILLDGTAAPPFADPSVRRRLAAAARLSGPTRYLTYGQLDLDLARNAAPLAAFGNLTSYDFFARRIGCQRYGIYGMDLGELCLRR
jgi:YVTN family beta-propeller protein